MAAIVFYLKRQSVLLKNVDAVEYTKHCRKWRCHFDGEIKLLGDLRVSVELHSLGAVN